MALPLAALAATERRSGTIRRALSLPPPRRRTVLPVAVALALLVSLIAVAAAQPVVVRRELVNERADAQAFFVFDTSLSMQASSGAGRPTRLARAKRLALRLRAKLTDLPIGIASMTDRTLPNLLPTTDPSLFARTLDQSVGINSPPPSQIYHGRATSFQALAPIVDSHFFSPGVQRRLLVVFTDGESQQISPILGVTLHREVTPVYVHVWAPGEQIYHGGTRRSDEQRGAPRAGADDRRRRVRGEPGRRDRPGRARRRRLREHADAHQRLRPARAGAVARPRRSGAPRLPALAAQRVGRRG